MKYVNGWIFILQNTFPVYKIFTPKVYLHDHLCQWIYNTAWYQIKAGSVCLILRNTGAVWNKLLLINYSHHCQDHLFIYLQKRKTEQRISALEKLDSWPGTLTWLSLKDRVSACLLVCWWSSISFPTFLVSGFPSWPFCSENFCTAPSSSINFKLQASSSSPST